MVDDSARRDEIATNLAAFGDRVAAACAAAGRDPGDLTVVVVTKTFPASDIRVLHALGVRDVGENRDQEAAGKAEQCADLGLRWHFVGQLQTNKARSVAGYADVVHSVDRLRLVRALDAAAARRGRVLRAFVQVDLAPGGERARDPGHGGREQEPGRGRAARGGAGPQEVLEVAAAVDAAGHLDLAGVMAVAPQHEPPEPAFARLAEISARVRAAHPGAVEVSAGMSGDLEAAVLHGATHLRVGSAILGSRPPLG